MEIVYLLVAIAGILLVLPIIGAIVILIVGLINRFRDISSLPRKRKQRFKAGDSMRIMDDGGTFDKYS